MFRRAICGIPTNFLNKTFATLVKEIDKKEYLESITASLLLKESYKRFPTDEEIRTQFPILPLYNLRIVDYTLRKLENYHHKKEPISVENYTIEHIMPQKIDSHNRKWIDELGPDWQQIHQKYIHTIGNLTLTGYNPELGNMSFLEKQNIEGGFKSSPLWLNKSIARIDHWNKDEIEKRASELTNLAIEIWPYPKINQLILSQYKKREEITDIDITEEDHFEKGSEMTIHYKILKSSILSIGSNIHIEAKKKYIAFLNNTNFVDIFSEDLI